MKALSFLALKSDSKKIHIFLVLYVPIVATKSLMGATTKFNPATPFIIFHILIELIPTASMLWFNNKTLHSDLRYDHTYL